MNLVMGGNNQGKLSYVLEKYNINIENVADGASCGFDKIANARVLYNLHELVKRLLISDENAQEAIENVITQNDDIIIVCDEIGCGLVPMDSFERRFRETTGRICCFLAKKATKVERVFCGIATTIKG